MVPKGMSARTRQITTRDTIVVSSAFTSSASAPSYGSYSFTVGAVNNFSSYAAIFDQYMLKLVEVWIVPSISNIAGGVLSGLYATGIDLDDAVVPTSVAQLIDYDTAVVTSLSAGHYHRFVPGVSPALYSGAFTSFGVNDSTSQWIDCASSAVIFYGLKFASTTASLAVPMGLIIKLTVSYRGQHN